MVRFEWGVAAASAALVVFGYMDAAGRLGVSGHPTTESAVGEAGLAIAWAALSAMLAFAVLSRTRAGAGFGDALPAGYGLSLAGCAVFGAGAVVEVFAWRHLFGYGTGLEALLSPPHLAEVLGGGMIVSGPLRAAVAAGAPRPGLPGLLSAALLLSSLTFVTQFASPLVDLWAADPARQPAPVGLGFGQNEAVSAIFIHSVLVVGMVLLLLRRFNLAPGSITAILVLNAALLAILKSHYELIAAAAVAGIAADAVVVAQHPGRERLAALRLLAALVPGSYTAAYLALVAAGGGLSLPPQLWLGLVIAMGLLGLLLSQVAFPGGPRATAEDRDDALQAGVAWAVRTGSLVDAAEVKSALESLRDDAALAASPLARLAPGGEGPLGAAAVRDLLTSVIGRLADSPAPRDAEAGRLLSDYYLRRVGSHEVVAERLHLSRPTFYRRLQRGLLLVAERLDEVQSTTSPPALRDGISEI